MDLAYQQNQFPRINKVKISFFFPYFSYFSSSYFTLHRFHGVSSPFVVYLFLPNVPHFPHLLPLDPPPPPLHRHSHSSILFIHLNHDYDNTISFSSFLRFCFPFVCLVSLQKVNTTLYVLQNDFVEKQKNDFQKLEIDNYVNIT